MAKGLTASKAKKILEDGTVRGKALTEKQKKFFGAVAGGATPLKKLNGGWLDKFGMGGSLPGASGMMYARTSGTSPEEPKRAQDGTVMYGTPEYKKAYEEGTFADIPNQLEEVVVTAGVDYEKYPLYDKLSAQQKEYFKDPGPIGRGIRRAAQTDRGLAEDTRDMVTGMLVKQPLAAIQAPQSLMVEGIEALRGRDANFLNALTFDTQRLPSQTMGFEDKPGWDLGGSLNTTMDVVADPLNLVGVGLVKNAIKKFTTPLKNIGKYYRNPLGDAFKIGNDNPRIPTFLTRGQNPPNPLRSNPKIDADNFMQSWTNPNNPSFVSKFDDQILKPFPMASMNENYLRVKTRELNVLQQQLDDFVEATGSNVLPKAKSLQKSIDDLTSEINMFYRPIRGNLARNNMKSIQAGEFNTVYSTTGVQPGSGGTYFVPSADQPMNTWKYMYPNKPNTRGVGNNSVVKIREVPVGATEAAKTKARTSEMLTGIHETLGHASNAGGAALTRQTNDLIKSALKPNLKIKEGTSKWVTDFIGPKATYKDWAKYLQEPTEMIARVMELRRQYINPKYWGTGKQYDIPDKLIDRMFRDGLSGKSKVNADFFRVIDKKGLKKLMKGLYATIPMAVGADGLLEYETPKYKDGGSTPKAQDGIGKKVASIASQMEANEEDGGRPPLGVVDHIRALFDEEGLCRDNTCVQTVKDFYSKAGIEAMPKDVYNNREFLKNFKEYGFEEILDQKNLQPGDVLQYYYGPDSEDVKEDPSYLNFPYHMGVYVNPGEYIGDGDSEAPIQRKNMYTGTKDGKEYKKDPFRAFRYTRQNKNGGWLSKYENGGVIEDDRGQWAHPGKVTKINSNNITMKGVNYPVLWSI